MIKKFLITILLLVCSIIVFSQSGGLYSFNELYGFKTNTVYDIHQDKTGLIWIASENGIFRFDGTNFKKYYHPSYDKEATNIKEDKDGRIWYSNFTGQIFYIENDSCILFDNYAKDLMSYIVFSIDRFPQIDVLTTHRVQTKNFYTKKKEDIHISNALKNRPQMNSIDFLDIIVFQGEFYCCYQKRKALNGTFTYEIVKYHAGEFSILYNAIETSDNVYTKLLKKRGAFYLIAYDTKQRMLYNVAGGPAKQILTAKSNSGSFPICLNLLDKNYLFMAEKNAAYIYNIEQGTKVFRNELAGLQIARAMIDLEGNEWFASTNGGIYIRTQERFTTYKFTNDKLLFSTFNPNGTAYVLTDKLDFISIDNKFEKAEIKGVTNIVPTSLVYDPYNRLAFFSTSTNGVFVNNDGKALGTRKIKVGAIKKSVFLNKDYYIGTSGYSSLLGLNNNSGSKLVNLTGDIIKKYDLFETTNLGTFARLRPKRCLGIALDNATQDVFIDYVDGVFCHGNYSSKEIKYNKRPIICEQIIADATKGVWLMDNQNELIRIIDRNVNSATSIPLPVKYMAQWKNFLFLASEDKIIKYDTLTKKIERFNFSDGMHSENIKNITVFDNKLRVLTETHVTDIPCRYNYINKVKPIVFINQVKIFNEALNVKPSYFLSQNDNNLEISFSALSIRSQKRYTYQYRMLGVSDNWITNSSSIPFVRFPKLESGNYIFELCACNEDGICSDIKTIEFVIKPHFYKSWWFVILSLLFFVGLAFLVTRYWFKKRANEQILEQEKEVLEKEVFKSKIAAIRSQMNPHFMFNALNTIQEFIMTNQKDVASEYLADFADLMRKYLEQSRGDEISLAEEVDTLHLYLKLEKLRFEDSFNYEINVQEGLETSELFIPVMLVQPFVENAIKHGLLHKKGEKHIVISIAREKGNVLLLIKDNGIGRCRSHKINRSRKGHRSFATSAIDERIKIYNQSDKYQINVEVQDENHEANNVGTSVRITISPN